MRILPLSLLLFLFSPACGKPHVETGGASWYGKDFRGRPTASGQTFRPGKKSAAHKTLPLGTVVVVTRLDTGERVRVMINDRGPYVGGRIVDLSKRAARRIGLIEDGHTEVRLKVVGCRDKFGKCD